MLITKGKWRDGITWEFHTGIIPYNELQNITAATVVIFSPDYKKVLLTFNTARDQWEFPGGKIDLDETVLAAAVREVFEEAGINIENPTPFGFKKISDTTGYINPPTGKKFPNPSYVIYHIITSDKNPKYPLTAIECSKAEYFNIDDAILSNEEKLIINTALKYVKTPK